MIFPQPFLDAGTFPGKDAAEAGFFFIGTCGAYLPVTAVYTVHQRGVTFRAPEIPAHAAQAHCGIVDRVYVGAVHRIVVPAVRARMHRIVPVGMPIFFDGQQESILYLVGEKLPHPQETARYCLTHRRTSSP